MFATDSFYDDTKFIKPENRQLKVTTHACDKFKKITRTSKCVEEIREKIKVMYNNSYKLNVSDGFYAMSTIRHSEPAEYYRYGNFVFVLTRDMTIVTLYEYTKNFPGYKKYKRFLKFGLKPKQRRRRNPQRRR